MDGMIWALFFITIGTLALLGGAESLVRGASQLALRLGISPLIVGLTIVSFSTSMPEATASFMASWYGGHGDMAVGNILGSNIANIGLIAGLTAIVLPIPVERASLCREIPLMIAVTLLLAVVMYFGTIGPVTGAIFLLLLFAYTYFQYRLAKGQRAKNGSSKFTDPVWREFVFINLGILGLILGGYWLVDGAIALAQILGVSERVIGITIVALGTSCPELATSLVAAARGHHELAIGNVVGSNIFNILFVLGGVSLVVPLDFSSALLMEDLPVTLGFAVALWAFTYSGKVISRWDGACLLTAYLGYIAWLVLA